MIEDQTVAIGEVAGSAPQTAQTIPDLKAQYVSRLPPCNVACPAGENIQEWLNHAQAERYEEAWRALVKNNPLPAIHGRVCYHPCEKACNRKHLDSAVSIHAVERFLGDLAISEGWNFQTRPPTGKRVLVVGSGPCGLSAAYHLALMGHSVTVHEARAKLGGMMRYGIPEYRLPRDVLDAEIDRIARMGVQFEVNAAVNDLDPFLKQRRFDAVFLAVGAQLGKRVDIPTDDARRIMDALTFLADPSASEPLCMGRRVAVYGGGNSAMDAARTALRLGARESMIVYRRNRDRMPAHESELEEALVEGVAVHWLRTIKHFDAGNVEVQVMQLDSKGVPQPTGKTETLQADTVILALGQETQGEFLKGVPGVTVAADGTIQVDEHLMTGCPGLFAGGDMVPDQKTVTIAVGHGKKAARNIDAYLHGETYVKSPRHSVARRDLIKFAKYPKTEPSTQPVLDVSQRLDSFAETVEGLDVQTATYEAHRCLSCGNCFECDACYNSCPSLAISKLGRGEGYYIAVYDCDGCKRCVRECPSAAIEMMAMDSL
jgi:NADPH-dependent glutamate synthase beta subunit-like oxidoreductase